MRQHKFTPNKSLEKSHTQKRSKSDSKPYSKTTSNLVFITALFAILFFMLVSCTPYNGQVYGNSGVVSRPYNTQPINTTTNETNNNGAAIDAYYPHNNMANDDVNRPTNGNNSSVARPFITQPGTTTTSNNSNTTYAYYPSDTGNNNIATTNTGPANTTAVNHNYKAPTPTMSVDQGVRALLDCTAELGYNAGYTANDYQYCLQINQADLSDYAFGILKDYILSWVDVAIDKALQTLGFMNGRSLGSVQAKSSQLTSIISTGYRWY